MLFIRLVSSYICMFALSLVEVVFRFSLRIYLACYFRVVIIARCNVRNVVLYLPYLVVSVM